MKNLLFLSVFLLVATFGVQAQQVQNSNTKVKVNVVLNPFQSIEIGNPGTGNDGQGITPGYGDEVTLTYATVEDYKQGVEKMIQGQLKVSSVGSGYKINANTYTTGTSTLSSTLTKERGAGESSIADAAKELLAIQIAGGNKRNFDQNMEGIYASSGSSDASSSVINQSLDVTYYGSSLENKTDLLKKLLGSAKPGAESAKYSIDVVYSISPN